jgi:biopolymer transport protein ExbD
VAFKNARSSNRSVVVDMTPMIDIVFQLLIFFLVTAQMAQQTRAQLDLPKEKGEEEKQQDIAGLTVNVLADGSIVVNDQTVSLEALDRMIDEAIGVAGGPDKLRPLIRADRKADSTRLNEVFNRLSGRGLSAIRLATERSR